MASSSINNIKVIETGIEELLQSAKKDFISQNSATLKQLISSLNSYLNELNTLVAEYNKSFTSLQGQFQSVSQQGGVAWKNYIRQKNDINIENHYLELIRKGELLIEQIRAKLTGEQTIVNIGVEYYGKLYQVSLSLAQALNMAKIGISSTGGIVLKSGNTNLNRSILVDIATEVANKEQVNLFRSLKSKSGNKGNAYEAFRNKQMELNKSLSLKKLISEIKANTTKGTFGGDVYYKYNNQIVSEQVKYYGKSQFSFLSLKTIQTTLTVYLECFQDFYNGNVSEEVMNKLKAEMIRSKITTRIEAAATKKAEQTLDEYLSHLTK